MNTLVESWGINFDGFKRVLRHADAAVIGGAALYVYFKQQQPEPLDPGFEPSNIDIFVPTDGVVGSDESDIKSITDFLESSGFHTFIEDNIDWRIVLQDESGQHNVRIKIVHCEDVVQHILRYGKLSANMSWWRPASRIYIGWAMTTNGPAAKHKKMYLVDNVSDIGNTDKLIQEYTAYGFKLVEIPCLIDKKRDLRAEIDSDKFKNIDACDIFTLEDIPLQDFLRASEYNIVLKAGERYYAFDRRALMAYMKTKEITVNSYVGKVYETPLNQCIPLLALEQLAYADFSIYELRPAYSVEVGTGLKSLFNLHCYSLERWIAAAQGEVKISAPSDISKLPEVHQNILMLLSSEHMRRFPDAGPMLEMAVENTEFNNIHEFMPPQARYSEQ